MTEVPANDLATDIALVSMENTVKDRPAMALEKIADVAEAATTASHAQTVAAQTSAAMSDFYSSALHTLANVKLQIANLEEALEIRRQQSMNEVEQFTKAVAETFNMAAVLSRTLKKIEQSAGLPRQ